MTTKEKMSNFEKLSEELQKEIITKVMEEKLKSVAEPKTEVKLSGGAPALVSGDMYESIVETEASSEKDLLELEAEVLGVDDDKLKDVKKRTASKPTNYVKLGKSFLVEKSVYTIVEHNIKHNINTMLLGPTGVGKTEMITEIASKMGIPVTIFDMGTMTDPIMSLVGTHVITIEDGKTKSEFKASRFSEVIQKPGIVVLDELSRAAAGSNNLLFPCLDFRRELPMEYSFNNTDPIKVHPNCVFIATANTGSAYTGTHKLDKALEDRFLIIEIESLNEAGCNYVLSCLYDSSSLDILTRKNIVSSYFKINDLHDDFKISFKLSMRHLKMIATLVINGFTVYDAFYTICKGVGGKEACEIIKPLLTK